ncbi:hypothetical protein ACFQZW_12155 [Lutibacter aestuarii]|uniref:Uncharacterized protein n=1 Tax=Lutibacter aestuarii TaxID=861111 RepID=A0ABW2ZC65_9FLAO
MGLKYNLNIIYVLIIFVFNANLIGQNKNLTSSFSNDRYQLTNTPKGYIVVFSIIDTVDSNTIQKLNDLAKSYKNKNIVFIVITDDNLNNCKINLLKNKYLNFLSENENNRIFNTYQISMYKVFPMYIVLNKKGKIIYKKKGRTNNIENKLKKRINKALK